MKELASRKLVNRAFKCSFLVSDPPVKGYVKISRIGSERLGEDEENTGDSTLIHDTTDVHRFLEELGVNVDPEQWDNAKEEIKEAISEQEELKPIQVAEGKKPELEQKREKAVEWSEDLRSNSDEDETDENDQVDFREEAGKNVQSVSRGDPIGTLKSDAEGESGVDVFGNKIELFGDEDLPFEPGENVEYNEETRTYAATESGLVQKKDGILEVSDVYRVEGDIDYDVGNVDFSGTVFVEGQIGDNFKVKAGKDVVVEGTVQAAQVEAGGDIRAKGGVKGRKKARLEAGGNVVARYINESDVTATGKVEVNGEIIDSEINTMDALRAPGGRLMGGEVVALNTVEVGVIGSKMGKETIVITGVSTHAYREIKDLQNEQEEVQEKIEYLETRIGQREITRERLKELPEEKVEKILDMVRNMKKLKSKSKRLGRRVKKLKSRTESQEVPEIIIRKKVFPDSVLTIGDVSLNVDKERKGPVRVVRDDEENTLNFVRSGL